MCLLRGECDIGMASRGVKDGEAAALAPIGDLRDPANERVLGLDGIAVVVNRRNPLTRLKLSQVADIFSGKVSS